jgi:16S rRNA (cytosine967-C5)-methyltransferase
LNLGAFLASRKGWLEVQDEGSQLAVLAAEPPPAGTVIDGCAGAGGKTLAILDLREAAGGAGEIHACDILGDKLDELCRRAALREARNLHIHRIAPEGPLPPGLPVQADLVFLDAPCSGTGTLRRSPDLKRRHGPADVTRFAALQASILRRFAPLVRPGGRLVYTTCSLLREENDAVVDLFLKEQPGFTGIGSPWARSHLSAQVQEGGRLRLDPLATGTDGFFVAILERTS